MVDHVAFPLEQDMQAAVAEAAAFMGDRLHALAKAGIVCPGRLVSHGHAAAADGFMPQGKAFYSDQRPRFENGQ